jgi:hypothetical protein
MKAAALFAFRLWCVIGWIFFVPVFAVRLLSSLLHAFGAAP